MMHKYRSSNFGIPNLDIKPYIVCSGYAWRPSHLQQYSATRLVLYTPAMINLHLYLNVVICLSRNNWLAIRFLAWRTAPASSDCEKTGVISKARRLDRVSASTGNLISRKKKLSLM